MKYEPHEYQRYAINYIEDHPFAAVLLDMGLGKTSITLTAIADLLFDSFEVHKVLVIAPLRVARDTWSAELQKWDQLHHLTYSVVVRRSETRSEAQRRRADHQPPRQHQSSCGNAGPHEDASRHGLDGLLRRIGSGQQALH